MYASEEQIVKSIGKLPVAGGQINTFIGLIMLLIYGRSQDDSYFSVEMVKVQRHLDKILHFNKNKPSRMPGKNSFILYNKNWINFIKDDLLRGSKVSANDFSLLVYWNEDFIDTKSPALRLKAEINNDVFFQNIFHLGDEIEINAEKVADPAVILKQLGGKIDFTYSVQDRRFINKTAGDLTAAPYAQTLYANKSLRECIFIADFDFLDKFELKKSSNIKLLPQTDNDFVFLPKPFLLLAGISGTGKSNFVKNQAARSGNYDNFLLIPVRPDWHEPSDLLGYVSRIGLTTKYIPTAFLVFITKAWLSVFESYSEKGLTLKPLDGVPSFWACLDELNLAPVEQYFADYLSVIETRKWTDEGTYSCEPLLRPAELLRGESELVFNNLKQDLGLEDAENLWSYFLECGITVPPNLIVAGTVNMDETTHGFSRKVIDRALTIDFDEFFPNNFDNFFSGQNTPITFKFSRYSHPSLARLNSSVPADPYGQKSIDFLKEINQILKGTSFPLAYRALSEMLLSLQCFRPTDQDELLALWDDFLMWKLLPRIGGDEDKLRNSDGQNIIETLLNFVLERFNSIQNNNKRIDLLSLNSDGSKIIIPFRTPSKLKWMNDRLTAGFTSFWP
jgi:hypothetical protein